MKWWIIWWYPNQNTTDYNIFQATQSQADAVKAKVNSPGQSPILSGPFNTQSAAAQYRSGLNNNALEVGLAAGLESPTQPLTGGNPDIGAAISKAATTSLNPLAGLFQGNIWIRVSEFAIGAVLVAVGLSKLAESSKSVQTIVSATPVGRVAKIAGAIK